MAGSKRQQQFSKLIQKEVSHIFTQEFSAEFLGKLVTVTDVTMSPDLGLARLYISVFPINAAHSVIDFLNSVKPRIRGKLGRSIGKDVRVIPELAFFMDTTAETGSRMDSLIDSLDIPEETEPEED
ncbi:30S ribosome-binding factor RbfA [Roseivirga misakiensis]|uniref:Ribosome-binding factor A n=1 Tax=Roseivirga misakiensis TaxID=1563681 RepID=A0A1E5T6P9_9BACT|nr:30S ribosome-binding factor RbfA [Roseivirga misakiensis]OEK07049.1 ribosome-binding factor A [Roseivirga misakiensis]